MSPKSTVKDVRTGVGNGSRDELTALIIEAISKQQNMSLSDVDPPINDVIDLDSLETLYRHANEHDESSWEISISIDQFDVTIESDGRITVVKSDAETE